MLARCLRAWRSCEVALPEGERALSLLACGAGSAGVACIDAAKTVGARNNTNTLTKRFIGKLPGLTPT